MKRLLAGIIKAVDNPVEMAIFVFALGLFVTGLYIMSPWYVLSISTPISQSFPARQAEIVLGLILSTASGPGLVAPFLNQPARNNVLRWASLGIFLSWIFLTITRIAVLGFFPIVWLPGLCIAIVCGGLRLYLEVHRD